MTSAAAGCRRDHYNDDDDDDSDHHQTDHDRPVGHHDLRHTVYYNCDGRHIATFSGPDPSPDSGNESGNDVLCHDYNGCTAE